MSCRKTVASMIWLLSCDRDRPRLWREVRAARWLPRLVVCERVERRGYERSYLRLERDGIQNGVQGFARVYIGWSGGQAAFWRCVRHLPFRPVRAAHQGLPAPSGSGPRPRPRLSPQTGKPRCRLHHDAPPKPSAPFPGQPTARVRAHSGREGAVGGAGPILVRPSSRIGAGFPRMRAGAGTE